MSRLLGFTAAPRAPEADWIGSLRIASGTADVPVSRVPAAWLLDWLADFELLPLYLAVALLASRILRDRDRGRSQSWSVFAAQLAAGSVLCLTLVATMKAALALPRPASAAVAGAHGLFELYAFPSGHAAFAAVLAMSAWRFMAPPARSGLVAFVLGAGLARIVLGKHYWLDVYAGWLLGVACAWAATATVRIAARDRWAAGCLALAALVLVADLMTKLAASAFIPYATAVPVSAFFNLVHWHNPGAAFSFLSDASGWQRPALIVVAALVSLWLARAIRSAAFSRLERVAFAAILGGAVANALDRLLRGAVVDWLDVHWAGVHWPAFNLADVSITLGAAGLVAAAFGATQWFSTQARP